MSLRRLALPAVLVLTLATPAFAQTPMDPLDARDARRLDKMEQVLRELRAIVFQGRDAGKPVVVQPAETDYQLQELGRRLSDLEQALTRVNGQLEASQNELTQARREIEILKRDGRALADRTLVLEQKTSAPPAPAEGTAPDLAGAAAPAANGPEVFAQARQAMLSGDYPAAEAGFADYVARFGDGPKGPEARYWLAKTLAARAAYADAAGAYIGAIRGWPSTPWAPDAVVELARALIQLKKPADACQTLDELARRYPKAPAPVTARAQAARTQARCAT